MSRPHNYLIAIYFDSDDDAKISSEYSEYLAGKSFKDELNFYKNKITISANRSNKVDIDGIFNNYTSALYNQIIKSLVYYYSITSKAVTLTKLEILHTYNNITEHKKTIKGYEINQIVSNNSDFSVLSKIDTTALKVIFNENKKGQTYLIALTHIIKSLCSENPYDAFERKWKAFNAIYRQISNKTKEFDRLCFIREQLVIHPQRYPLIITMVSKLSSKTVRDNTRWIKFIHNNFSDGNQAKNYHGFIVSNDDFRLAEINKATLSVRQPQLEAANLYDTAIQHIDDKINKKVVNNSHLAATLCIKYMYFVRNKSIHAEKIESAFRLTKSNKEEKEIKWLSSLLDLLLLDLVNAEQNF